MRDRELELWKDQGIDIDQGGTECSGTEESNYPLAIEKYCLVEDLDADKDLKCHLYDESCYH